ncbi:hypothetical protein DL769_000221 [Monosporascus sp. CRB-8-3]|nr:hypothetical protein DL769_000221 [Monosporascus sp. CRB-8-3]
MSHSVNNSGMPDIVTEAVPGSQPSAMASNQPQPTNDSSNDSQATTVITESDRVLTPPGSDSSASTGHANANNPPSQDSQLFQLSQLAAAQERMAERDDGAPNGGNSRKRMADGVVKHARGNSNTSPVRQGHSRNTSAVSAASTTGSRIGELSAELRAKLSYAMVKVNNGWQSHSIDEVESLASQVGSPTSSTCTLHGRHGASASPRMRTTSGRQGVSSATTSPTAQAPPQIRTYESFWRENNTRPRSSTAPHVPTLAPPAAIEPRQQANPRRNSNTRYAPAYLSHSTRASPHTPAQTGSLTGTPGQPTSRTPNIDPILFSPHQNMREQEALETLVFMSSPGNSANLKHAFPSSQTPQNSQSPQPRSSMRTALPTSRLGSISESNSQGRKTLPNGRPQAQHTQQIKRVGFEKTPSDVTEMEVDESYASPQARTTPRRRTNGTISRPSLSIPAGLSGPSRPRPKLRDDDIERMLDRVAADDSSDSDGEIHIPQGRRREGARIGV